MTANIQYFGNMLDFISKRVNEACVSSNDQYLDTLTPLVKKLVVTTCEIYYASSHSTDMCSTFQDDLNAPNQHFRGFPIMSQTWYDPNSNVHNQGWWNNSNFNYAVRPRVFRYQYQ